ncbi:TonB-dependent receptor [Parasediminibacterium sp. JCM 36343]|uniref:TonB-dependent receptor n=1 Tax=Parasediminibacterium sp. JCM 36343 TaxID=3374279 RepID=UPI00397A84EB
MKSLFTFLLLCCSLFAWSQATKISGTITSNNGTPLENATIKVKSSKTISSTNSAGAFSVSVAPSDELEISIVGYATKKVKVTNTTTGLSIVLEASSVDLKEVVVLGSRRAGRVKTETAVPVDVVNMSQASLPTAKMDLTSVLNAAAPSFNYNKQSGSDGADHVDLATLRGLGPDQTLVLVNGKRRHQTAFVAVFGTRGRGNSGTDLNAIPEGSIDHVEILRDGASAQYGSDAIAGVINLVLKKDIKQLSANVGWSGYNDKKYNSWYGRSLGQYEYGSPIDGNTLSVNLNYGLPIGKQGGFINVTGGFSAVGKTFRQVLDTSNLFGNKDALIINNVRRANGDASMNGGGVFINAEIPVSSSTTFYTFGGANYKASDAFAFSRNYPSRPDKFPSDANGNPVLVSGIMHVTPDGTDTFYNPHIQTHISDFSFAAGLKGTWAHSWNWDLSNVIGRNDFHYYGDKTFNASLGTSKTHFDDGGFNFLQNTANFNVSKEVPNVASGFNIAFGAEYRFENYKIYKGEEASYKNYDPNKLSGAQGYPGYQPADVVDAKRNVGGIYADAEMDVTKKWLVGLALRAENYNDFGSTANFKIASRYKITNNFNVRGSFSTGFRAPSLQQINFSNTFTTVQGPNSFDVKIAPNYSPIAKAAGIPDLKQEKSQNGSLGFTWKPVKELSITVDGYYVKIKDRVVLSGQFSASDPTLDAGLTTTLNNLKVGSAQFFANAVNTTNKGVDIVLEYNKKWNKQSFKVLLAGNLQHMTIDDINTPAKLNDNDSHRLTFLSYRERNFILASAPPAKISLGFDYTYKKLGAGLHFTYFGKIDLFGYGDGTPTDFSNNFQNGDLLAYVPADVDNHPVRDEYIYHPKISTDIYLSYKLCKAATFFIGADNLFNAHPDYGFLQSAKYWAFNDEAGGPWDAVQMGTNGRRLFARLAFNF